MFHYDMWFMVDAALKSGQAVKCPSWFEDLSFEIPEAIPRKGWARFHDDVVARWKRARPALNERVREG